jgi:hypothetical protein
MALKVAVANGNWSNPATWLNGTLPQIGDIVASNGFTVTIDQNVNVDFITNTAQTAQSIIPFMTSNSAPSGTASTNNSFGGGYEPFKAFDGSVSGASNHWLTQNNPTLPWLEYEFPTPKTIVGYSIETNYNSIPNTWQFQAWDGSSWVILDTVSGRTSNSLLLRTFSNTTAYTRYRLYITAINGTNASVGELRLFDDMGYTQNSVAGGGFILNSGFTVTCTNTTYGLLSSTSQVTLLTYSGSGISTINASIPISPSNNVSFPTVLFTGSGTLNINGTMKGFSSQSGVSNNSRTLILNGSGTVNIVGNIEVSYVHDAPMITTSNNVTVNHTGDIYTVFTSGNNGRALDIGLSTWTTTGTITGLNRSSISQVNIASNGRFFHVGSIIAGSSGNGVIYNLGFAQLNSVMNVGINNQVCLRSDSSSAINLCSGPFVCSIYGFMPILCVRMHLIPSVTSYFEFRDETTNGAVSPGPIAPAARLVQPGYAVDAPAPANVRTGVVYASGTQTGTLAMPAAGSVAFGVPVDNTTGTALLSPADVWTAATSAMTTAGSIGERLKNASTVDTTGDQLAALL